MSNLDPEALRLRALQAREKKQSPEVEETPTFTDSMVDSEALNIESWINEYTDDGHLSMVYDFPDHDPRYVAAVSAKLKEKNPKLMIITDRKSITITWDGLNHV